MERSYSKLQHADDIATVTLCPYGLGRPTISRAGWSPAGGGNGRDVEMAVSLISTRLLQMISNRLVGNRRGPRRRHFQISKVISRTWRRVPRILLFYGVVLWSHKTAT